jgi:uncharacterized peroxidase-related enzyme
MMRLERVRKGHGLKALLLRPAYRLLTGRSMHDMYAVTIYRPELFGSPFRAYWFDIMRGQSSWTVGERELLGTFSSNLLQCRFCTAQHRENALQEFSAEVVDAVLADWRNAPVDRRLKAAIGFIEKLTLSPAEIGPADVLSLRAEGIGDRAIEDLIHVRGLFGIATRMADALGFDLPDPVAAARERRAVAVMRRGRTLLPWAITASTVLMCACHCVPDL